MAFGTQNDIDALSLSRAIRTANSGGFNRVGGASNPLLLESFLQFDEILGRKGATDPARLNKDIRVIQQAGQSAAQDTEGSLARSKLTRSGAGQAVMSAQRAATAGQIGNRRILETQIQEKQQRQDIAQFFSMLQLSLGGAGLNLQELMQQRGIDQQNKMAIFNAIGGVLGGVASGGISLGGGGGGDDDAPK